MKKLEPKKPKRLSPFTATLEQANTCIDDRFFLYVAGPISGRENRNQEAFEAARDALLRVGYNVVTPHDFVSPYLDWIDAMRYTIGELRYIDGVAMLDDYELSDGAVIEGLAAVHIGRPVFFVDAWIELAEHPEQIVDVCQKCAKYASDNDQEKSGILSALSADIDIMFARECRE